MTIILLAAGGFFALGWINGVRWENKPFLMKGNDKKVAKPTMGEMK